MDRKNFILASILAAPVAALAKLGINPNTTMPDKPGKGMVIRADESRFFGKPSSSKSTYGRCVISSSDTNNQLFISSGSPLTYQKKGGPPLHIHHKDDEIFYVMSGEFLFQMDKEFYLAKAGDAVFCPRGSAHTFSNPVDNNPGNMLIIHQPISPDLERFYEVFFETGYLSEENLKKAFPQADLKQLMDNNPFVGPPIDIEMAMKNLG